MTTPQIPPPLAEGAATAERPAGPCALCSRGILAGERHARLLTGKLAHLPCIGRATWRRKTTAAGRPA
jgi:hypothetical protein